MSDDNIPDSIVILAACAALALAMALGAILFGAMT